MIKTIIEKTQSEGLGSCYERCQMNFLLPRILKGLVIKTILESPAKISRGWDNLAFLNQSHRVTIADNPIAKIEKAWPYKLKPSFVSSTNLNHRFDLVWNFATIHQDSKILTKMISLSKRYVLVFTPNGLNWGWPIHWGLHLLAQTKCHHPERGPFSLMNLWGLQSFLKENGLTVVKSGYFDIPFWPDFAFSIKEIKRIAPFLKGGVQTIGNLGPKINQARIFEKKLPKVLYPFIAHHQYVLAEKR